MPIQWDPSDQEVPWLLGFYYFVLSRGVFETVEAADLWRLVTDWEEGGTRKEM